MIAATARPRTRRSDSLLAAVAPFPRVAVVMHDNPDPDAIATGWAVKFLLDHCTDKPVRLIGGGDIIRAENRQMVKLLRPPLELVEELRTDGQTAAVLVDCGPDATNHLLGSGDVLPVAVIDHHEPSALPGERRLPGTRGQLRHNGNGNGAGRVFFDVRPHVAASATIATTYLRDQRLEPPSELATALLYAIRTETRGRECHYSRIDRAVLPWLTRRSDPTLLAEIEDAPLTRGYFSDLVLGLQNTFVYGDAAPLADGTLQWGPETYGDTAFCMLPHAEGPETVGELADLLVRCEGLRRVLCAAVFEHAVLISVRTERDAGNATELLRETIRGLGRGGGHLHRAGGKLTAGAAGVRVPEEVQEDLRTRWLRACGISTADGGGCLRGTRLIDKEAIMGNLR